VFEPEVVAEARRHIRPGTAVLDVGANFGQMAVLFARLVGEQGTVHAFEADPFVCELLRRNVAENACRNVIVHEGAVWNQANRTLIFPEPDFQRFGSYGSYGIDPRAQEGRNVRSLTIDSLEIEQSVSFMKVDVQGSDLFALQGAEDTIRRNQMPVLFEFETQFQAEFGTSFNDYTAFIAHIGYEVTGVVLGINYLISPRRSWWRRLITAR
jgi:FkbM family methyltransferase